MGPVDLECGGIMLRDEFESVVGGLEKVRALEELRASLVPGLEDDLEELVDRLFRSRRADNRVQLGFVLRSKLDTVLLGERLRELRAGEQTARDEDLTQTAALFTLRCERALELRLRQELHVDEELAEWAPRLLGLRGDRRQWRGRTLLGRKLDAVLLGKNACERERGEVAVADEDLAEQPTGLRLLGECLLELVLGQQLFGDENLAELTPRELD